MHGVPCQGWVSGRAPESITFTTCDDPATWPFEHDARAIADDRRWFASHPQRCHRIRPPGIGERQTMRRGDQPDDPRMRPFVVVRQVVPDVRLRQPSWLTVRAPNLEAIAHAIFDLVLEAAAGGECFIPPEIVRQRVSLLAGAGCA